MAKQPSTSYQVVSPEQFLYAKVLEKGMIIGLVLLIVTFVIYATGIIKPYIPRNEMSRYWSHNVTDYLHMAHVKAGWSWLGMLHYGDFLNFVPIAILAGTTIFCFLAIVPTLWRKNDKVYAVFAVLEAIILAVAASGILGSGGH
jgi:phosphoglycerol transferase MdoB-like AlkP superfamily enzyme